MCIKKELKHLKRSYKLKKEQWGMSIGYDLLFYIFVIIGFAAYLGYLEHYSVAIPDFDPAKDLTDTAKLQAATSTLSDFIYAFYIGALVYSLFFVICWGSLKGLIWSVISKRKATLHHIKQYVLLSLGWLYGFLIVSLLILLSLKVEAAPYAFIILVALFVHLSLVIYSIFTKENKIWHAVKTGFVIAFSKLHHFLIPYAIMAIAYIIISLTVFKLMAALLPVIASSFLSLAVTVGFVTWVRHYILIIVYDLLGYKL